MAKKQNPILAAFEAKKEKEFEGRLSRNAELNMMAMLIAANNLRLVGPKHAGDLLEEQITVKMEIARDVIEAADIDNDKDLCKPKRDLSWRLKDILGAENWPRYQRLFPMLKDYWED